RAGLARSRPCPGVGIPLMVGRLDYPRADATRGCPRQDGHRMPRFVDYQDAVNYARRTLRLGREDLVRGLDAAPAAAAALLQRLLVQQLHPDAQPDADPALRSLRTELFKQLWPRIEAVLDGETH